jgi:SAM-dependent methyltransferase
LNSISLAPAGARVLDLGAGTGRIGGAFVEAGDAYIGVDLSLPMLRQFRASGADLVQAAGEQLPFQDSVFDVALLMHILSGLPDRRRVLEEVRRVLKPGGVAIVGQTVGDELGIDAQLKRQLAAALSKLGVEDRPQGAGRGEGLAMLQSVAQNCTHVIAASWTQDRAPRDFLRRKPTGHRFAALPVPVQEAALARVSSWAVATFGSLDAVVPEAYVFELNVFVF